MDLAVGLKLPPYKLHGNKRREKGRRGGKRGKMNKAGMEVEEKK
jgi:hypothetical protein